VKLDNVTLVPASLLSYELEWQRVADDLPRGAVLIVEPVAVRELSVMAKVSASLHTHGRTISVVPASQITTAMRRKRVICCSPLHGYEQGECVTADEVLGLNEPVGGSGIRGFLTRLNLSLGTTWTSLT
jgi:hypothetical protein